MNRRTSALLVAPIALGLVAVAAALPASADTDDITGGNILWSNVDDGSPFISDAESYYPDLLGSGVALPFGWTGDALDGIPEGSIRVGGENISWTSVPGGSGWVSGGLSSFQYAGVSTSYEIDALLEIQGNYARWTFTPVSGPADTFEMVANLGSDGYQDATVVTANSAVVSSDQNAADPVIGYWFSGPSGTLDVPDSSGGSNDDVTWTAETSGPIVAILALQDYAPCAEATATAEMVARVANLNGTFGQSIEGALECATVATPAALSQGTAASQSLPVTIDPTIDPWMADSWQLEDRGSYLSD
ncbi:hypothetical protein FJ656_16575, partial [Schumannella luteola]